MDSKFIKDTNNFLTSLYFKANKLQFMNGKPKVLKSVLIFMRKFARDHVDYYRSFDKVVEDLDSCICWENYYGPREGFWFSLNQVMDEFYKFFYSLRDSLYHVSRFNDFLYSSFSILDYACILLRYYYKDSRLEWGGVVWYSFFDSNFESYSVDYFKELYKNGKFRDCIFSFISYVGSMISVSEESGVLYHFLDEKAVDSLRDSVRHRNFSGDGIQYWFGVVRKEMLGLRGELDPDSTDGKHLSLACDLLDVTDKSIKRYYEDLHGFSRNEALYADDMTSIEKALSMLSEENTIIGVHKGLEELARFAQVAKSKKCGYAINSVLFVLDNSGESAALKMYRCIDEELDQLYSNCSDEDLRAYIQFGLQLSYKINSVLKDLCYVGLESTTLTKNSESEPVSLTKNSESEPVILTKNHEPERSANDTLFDRFVSCFGERATKWSLQHLGVLALCFSSHVASGKKSSIEFSNEQYDPEQNVFGVSTASVFQALVKGSELEGQVIQEIAIDPLCVLHDLGFSMEDFCSRVEEREPVLTAILYREAFNIESARSNILQAISLADSARLRLATECKLLGEACCNSKGDPQEVLAEMQHMIDEIHNSIPGKSPDA